MVEENLQCLVEFYEHHQGKCHLQNPEVQYLISLCSDSFISYCQSLSPFSHQTPSALQRAVGPPSILTALGEEREVHRMKINRVSSGTDAKFPRWDNGRNPFDYRGQRWKVNKQIRATTRKHSLVFTVQTLDTSGIFLLRPSLFTSRLRFRRA